MPGDKGLPVICLELNLFNAGKPGLGGCDPRRVREIHEPPLAEIGGDADGHICGDDPEEGLHAFFSDIRLHGRALTIENPLVEKTG